MAFRFQFPEVKWSGSSFGDAVNQWYFMSYFEWKPWSSSSRKIFGRKLAHRLLPIYHCIKIDPWPPKYIGKMRLDECIQQVPLVLHLMINCVFFFEVACKIPQFFHPFFCHFGLYMVRNYTYSPFLSDFLKKKKRQRDISDPNDFWKESGSSNSWQQKGSPQFAWGKKKIPKTFLP